MMTQETITKTSLTNLNPTHQGKVRDLYEFEDKLLIVSTDRISAYDFVLPNGIPYKGHVLTGIYEFWFDYTELIVKNHMITTNPTEYPEIQQSDIPMLNGRSMLVQRANRIDIECVVRGYIAGSAWKEYQADGTVCGEKLPGGLIESEKLPELIFTPATKAEQGDHDENISIQRMQNEVGVQLTEKLIETSFELFQSASAHADSVGLILCDTKFEFGLINEELILIDEIFTPDSSRFWPKDLYNPGGPQQSFDKQFVRDYLMEICWNKQPPVPQLSDEVVRKTSEKYLEAYHLIIGSELG